MTTNAGEDVVNKDPLCSDCGVSTALSIMEVRTEGPWDRDKTTDHVARYITPG